MRSPDQPRRPPWTLILAICVAGSLAIGLLVGRAIRPGVESSQLATIGSLRAALGDTQHSLATAEAKNAELVAIADGNLNDLQKRLATVEAEAEDRVQTAQNALAKLAAQAAVTDVAPVSALHKVLLRAAAAKGITLELEDVERPLAYSWITNGENEGVLVLYMNGQLRNRQGEKGPDSAWWRLNDGFALEFDGSLQWGFRRVGPGRFAGDYAGPAKSRANETAQLQAINIDAEAAAWKQTRPGRPAPPPVARPALP